MYTYSNGNEYTGAVQFINGAAYDAAGQPLVYTEIASSGLEAGNESGKMQAAGEAEQGTRTESEMFGLDLSPNLRDEGSGFFKTLFTAGSNLSTDAIQELDYIAQAVANPIDTGEAVLRVLAGYSQKALPDSWEQYLPEDWATNKMYANAINEYYADKYGSLEQAADSFAEQPVSVALDALAVKALMTAISKQATTRSATTTKMAETAKGTVLESELAARAATELKVAQELERTVKYEGKLVYDEALGAYVPESSVVKPKIDAAEAAPIIAKIDEAKPTLNNGPDGLNDTSKSGAILGISDEGNALLAADLNKGMMTATRNQEVSPALAAEAANASKLANSVRVTSDDIAYYQMLKEAEARGGDFEGMAGYLEPEQLRALEAATGTSVLDNGTPRFNDPDLPFNNKQRMDDDAAMAAAIQDDLFTNASPAAYENYQATRLAALADNTALATTAPRGMMTSKVAGPISRTKDIDIPVVAPRTLTNKVSGPISRTKDIDIPPPRTTPKPVNQTETVIKPANVLPAAQRVAAAASQTGLQGERGTDGSFLPELPDRGIDIDQSIGASVPEPVEIIKSSEKPGWFQGVTKEDDADGNYWSADFEDEHWNTPAGVQEAIGIWGRPIGNRIGQSFN